MNRTCVALAALVACQSEPVGAMRVAPAGFVGSSPGTSSPSNPTSSGDPTPTPTTPTTADSGTGGTDALLGYIGSPCGSDADCPYAGGVCLLDAQGFPSGTCSAPCDQYCEDAVGYPTTFCAAIAELPADVDFLGDGGCLSRCDFGAYPYVGCRDGYGCVPTERANEPEAVVGVCRPNVESELSDCQADLAARGVPFTPTWLADDHPTDVPSLTCHIEEPIVFASGYRGVDLAYSTDPPGTVLGACSFGQALADSIEGLADQGVLVAHHLGTYNCRTIAGTTELSRHAYGDAIDWASFELDSGDTWTVEFDWEVGDASPESPGGIWLYDTAHGWHDDLVWTIVLTPDYNAAHYNHFHTDLTPGSDFLGFTGPGFFGPSPWPDE